MRSQLTICLHSGTTLLDRLIRWQTRGKYSHSSVLLRDGRHVEARPFKGVVVHETFTPAPGETVDFYVVNMTAKQAEQISVFLLDQVGCEYDWRAILCFLTRTRPKKASPTRWICSELIVDPCLKYGVKLFRATQGYEISPVDLGRSPVLDQL